MIVLSRVEVRAANPGPIPSRTICTSSPDHRNPESHRVARLKVYPSARTGEICDHQRTSSNLGDYSIINHEVRTSEDDGYVLCGTKRGDKLDGAYISKRFKKYVKLAKLSDDLTFHSLRHSFITWGIQAGVPVLVMQKLAGHAAIKTTMAYVHVAGGDLHDAIKKMSGRRERLSSSA